VFQIPCRDSALSLSADATARRPYLTAAKDSGHYNMKTMNDRVSIHNRDDDEDG